MEHCPQRKKQRSTHSTHCRSRHSKAEPCTLPICLNCYPVSGAHASRCSDPGLCTRQCFSSGRVCRPVGAQALSSGDAATIRPNTLSVGLDDHDFAHAREAAIPVWRPAPCARVCGMHEANRPALRGWRALLNYNHCSTTATVSRRRWIEAPKPDIDNRPG